MLNAVGTAQRILVLGGSSDIAVAIAKRFVTAGTKEIILAAREQSANLPGAKTTLEKLGAKVTTLPFDATDFDSHPKLIDDAFAGGDIDVAIVAFGVLGDNEELWHNQQKAVAAAQTNYTASVSVGVLLAEKLQQQGHGTIVAISSVAGVKVRRSNFVYGSTKAGFDGFYTQLGEALRDTGVHVVTVRPGQVRTRMTEGLKDAPLTVNKDDVAEATYDAVINRKPVVWCHPLFKYVMMVLQHIPQPILRKLPI